MSSPSPGVLRVAFDGAALTSPAGGVRRYAHELFGALAQCDRVTVTAVSPDVDAPVPRGVGRTSTRLRVPTNLGRAAVTLPWHLRSVPHDVFHAPAYTAPLVSTVPLVVTIHDVVYARRPEWYPGPLDPLRQWFYRVSARRATRVVTDSRFSQQEISAAYGLPADRIDVVPLAAAALFTPDASVPRTREVLHVGDLHPRRNLRRLLEVVLALRQDPACADVTLTLIGTDRGEREVLERRAAEAGVPGVIRFRAGIDDAALLHHYRAAAVLAYPSRYEGFGVPLLEAMQCGTPVVASRAASIPEVVGDAATLVDPEDDQGWFAALRAVLVDPHHARALGEAGRQRARTFSWHRTAAATRACYLSALGRPA